MLSTHPTHPLNFVFLFLDCSVYNKWMGWTTQCGAKAKIAKQWRWCTIAAMPTFLNCDVWRLLIFLPASNTMADSEWVQWDDVANEADAANQTESMSKQTYAGATWILRRWTMERAANSTTKPVWYETNSKRTGDRLFWPCRWLQRVGFGLIGSGRGCWLIAEGRSEKHSVASSKAGGREAAEREALDVWKGSKRIPLLYSMSNRWRRRRAERRTLDSRFF